MFTEWYISKSNAFFRAKRKEQNMEIKNNSPVVGTAAAAAALHHKKRRPQSFKSDTIWVIRRILFRRNSISCLINKSLQS